MPEWTARLELTNDTSQTLSVKDSWLHSKSYRRKFANEIKPGETGIFEVFTKKGVAAGPEYKVWLESQADTKDESLGKIYYHIDIPYTKSANFAECKAQGSLGTDGFKPVPRSVHDWTHKITIKNQLAADHVHEGIDPSLSWQNVMGLASVEEAPDVEEFLKLAKNNVLQRLYYRSEPIMVPEKNWPTFTDSKVTNDYKKSLIKDYRLVRAWGIKRSKQIVLPKDTIRKDETKVTHASQLRNTLEKEMLLETSLGASGGGCSAQVKSAFKIKNLNEYIKSTEQVTTETLDYEKKPYDRHLNYYDITQTIMLYRCDKHGVVSLVAADDYYYNRFSKTFDFDKDLVKV
ncbi:hypothetical protein ACFP1L_03965 [Lactiplantibacillus nangangensis]|uniref:Uncharacterized protein n=1 Tax=Lactiplantibacillus nangangensis TaxID=2559917 RepID=A0ABW1SID1_9LACO